MKMHKATYQKAPKVDFIPGKSKDLDYYMTEENNEVDNSKDNTKKAN